MENIININEMMRQNLFDRSPNMNNGNNNSYNTYDTYDSQMNREVSQNIGRKYAHENMSCNPELGICSVPMQEWEQVYDEDTGFSAGTIFPCLNKPFLGGGK